MYTTSSSNHVFISHKTEMTGKDDPPQMCDMCHKANAMRDTKWQWQVCPRCCVIPSDVVYCKTCASLLLEKYGLQDCSSDTFPCISRKFCPHCSQQRPVILCTYCETAMPTDNCDCINCYAMDLKHSRCDYCVIMRGLPKNWPEVEDSGEDV